jgi:transposase
VLDRYGIQYTIAGMTDWLLRNGFVYKKPMKIPKKLDPEKQEAFVKKYHELKGQLKDGELILFMDATHPEYQSQSSYGWILKGEIKTLTTTTKQERVHFLGAIELNQMQIVAQEYETVNADSTVDFLKRLEEKIPASKIYLICDNASPNRCKKVQGYVKNSKRIEIHYLPPYSPNLNPIERLWKVMREEVTYNKMNKEFKDFSNAMREFFYEKVKQLKQFLSFPNFFIDSYPVMQISGSSSDSFQSSRFSRRYLSLFLPSTSSHLVAMRSPSVSPRAVSNICTFSSWIFAIIDETVSVLD